MYAFQRAGLIAMIVAASAAVLGQPSLASTAKRPIVAGPQLLFKCRTDQLTTLRRRPDATLEQQYSVVRRQSVHGEIALTLEPRTHAMMLILRTKGGPTQSFALKNVGQVNSGTSGTALKADTTIRGTSARGDFTLFAEYDNNGFDHDAALVMEGPAPILLRCGDPQYSAPTVRGPGRYQLTNIYTLAADGFALKIEELPEDSELMSLLLEGSR